MLEDASLAVEAVFGVGAALDPLAEVLTVLLGVWESPDLSAVPYDGWES